MSVRIVIVRSLIFSVFMIIAMYLANVLLRTSAYISDVGGLSAFLTVFGTLYGIMTAFIVFEVWGQYNKTVELIEKEATGVERLFRLTLYFRDNALTKKMKEALKKYADIVIQSKFKKLGEGERNVNSDKIFREIAAIIKNIKFDDNHDQTVFDHIVNHYGSLSEIRTERINQSVTRLPVLLKSFIYICSSLVILAFIVMPFNNIYYGFLVTGTISFLLAMIHQLIEDLDNPFVGFWNVTPEPFERALKHIEESY